MTRLPRNVDLPYSREVRIADVQSWRDGWWYFVSIGGEVVWKHLTRDTFTHLDICFYVHAPHPTRDKIEKVILHRGDRRLTSRKNIRVPIAQPDWGG